MLPQVVFDQIVKTSGIRGEVGRHERRGAIRVPIRATADFRAIHHGRASAPVKVRLRDVSLSGIALLITAKIRLSKEFTLTLSLGEGRMLTLHCYVRRFSTHDGCRVISAMFLKMMLPGQAVTDDLQIATLNWHTFRERPTEPGQRPPDLRDAA